MARKLTISSSLLRRTILQTIVETLCFCPGKAYDRSPCGTGTSAKMACLVEAGKLAPGDAWRQEGILGTVFEGRVRIETEPSFPRSPDRPLLLRKARSSSIRKIRSAMESARDAIFVRCSHRWRRNCWSGHRGSVRKSRNARCARGARCHGRWRNGGRNGPHRRHG